MAVNLIIHWMKLSDSTFTVLKLGTIILVSLNLRQHAGKKEKHIKLYFAIVQHNFSKYPNIRDAYKTFDGDSLKLSIKF